MSCVYTLWLKRRTPQNIVIGGLAGALPPAIGWAAVTGSLSLAPLVLVAIIFMWTPPHFWALSLWRSRRLCPRRRADAAGGARARPSPAARSCSIRCCWRRLGVLPAFIGLGGMLYLVASASMGFWMLLEAFATWRERDEVEGARRQAAVRRFAALYVRAVRRPDRRASASSSAAVDMRRWTMTDRADGRSARRERRKRNIALALVLGALVILFYRDVDRAVARAFRPLERA